jgi:hypothetical protein
VRNAIPAFLTGILALGLAACGGMITYVTDSRPIEREVKVDGKSDEWVGALSIISGAKAEEGFLNDQNFLYVCFITEDESLRHQITRGGLMVWFDPKGGDEKMLGIKYPLGMPRRERPRSGQEAAGLPAEETAESDASSFDVFRSGNAAPQKMAISDAKGLEIASSAGGGLFVYELKIPLQPAAGYPIALGAVPGTKVSVGFEVPQAEGRPTGGPHSGGMGGRGGGSGGGGGMFGGGRGHRGGGMGGRDMGSEGSRGLKVWTYVKLSAGKGLAPARPGN